MKRKKIFKRLLRGLAVMATIYSGVWILGFYRVQSFERDLRKKHRERGRAVEDFMEGLEVGHSADLVKEFPLSSKGKGESSFLISYYDSIDENAAASNRGGKSYTIWIGSGEVVSIEEKGFIEHGDKFGHPLFYYPRVALFGLDTTEGL